MPVAQLANLKLRIIVESPWATAQRLSTVYSSPVEPQTFFSQFSGEKADSQDKKKHTICITAS